MRRTCWWCDRSAPEADMTRYYGKWGVPGRGGVPTADAEGDAKAGGEKVSDELRRLIYQLTSGTPCRLDHHGYCQEHAWFEEEECPEAMAAKLLDGWEPES